MHGKNLKGIHWDLKTGAPVARIAGPKGEDDGYNFRGVHASTEGLGDNTWDTLKSQYSSEDKRYPVVDRRWKDIAKRDRAGTGFDQRMQSHFSPDY